jgi:four helix bundle protein
MENNLHTADHSSLKRRCFNYSVNIVKFANSINKKGVNYSLFDQLVRSSTSIGANIVEAISASSKKDFINYYQIALKSSNEAKYWLYLIEKSFMDGNDNIKSLLKECIAISKIIASSVIKLKSGK